MSLLEIRHLSKFLGGRAACCDVSFSVERREVVALVGPNGSGKSMLLDCITGFHHPNRGEVRFRGVRLNGLSPDRICRMGLIRTWRSGRPLAGMTVLDNVVVAALSRIRRVSSARAVALEQLRTVGLRPRAQAPAGGLSLADRRKLDLARALATRPELILLDDPLTGLEPDDSDEAIRLVGELRGAGIAALVLEHDMRAVMRMADRVVVLDGGEKLAEGKPAEVVRNREVVAAYLGKVV
jgi:branched-chain amino acid transport system ATP-binding protein